MEKSTPQWLTRNKLRITIKGELMESYSSREVLKILREDGWYEVACDGSHHQLKHSWKKGRVTLTHPRNTVPISILKSIENQAGVKFR